MKERTITILYGTFVSLMVLILGLAYANITTELKIEGEGDAKEQEGVYIANVEYLTNNGADKDNSKINYTLGTMLDSKIVLGSSTSSSITYKVTIKNNTDREQVFIGIIKDETNAEAYNNTSIQPNVETVEGVTGIEAGKTTIPPGEYLIFPVTYAYAGTDTSNNELQGKINFRFREKPILELSNNGETYTLENIYAGCTPAEYEFTVSNYNETYTNGVPLTYSIETILTEGCPLTATIYDSEGNELTESITMAGDNNTYEDHTYTLKIEWDSNLDSAEYEGKSYTCTVDLTAIPDTTVDADLADYGDYKIEQGFEIEITTCSHTWENGVCTICGKICEHVYGDWVTVTEATCGAEGLKKRICSICSLEETETIAATGNHTYGDWVTVTAPTCTAQGTNKRTCTVCGYEETAKPDALGHNWVNGVCSKCGLECEHTFVDGTCLICGEKEVETIPTTTAYVGCYADMNRDGKVDGVIFADQGYGQTGTSPWRDSYGPYSITKITSGLKEYYVSQESYTNSNWGTHPVISPVEGTSGTDRFYVMKLSDFTTSSYSTFYWYYSASSEASLDDTIGLTKHDFGEGYEKTGEMITRWNNKTYGKQNERDVWGLIQTEYANGWFVPSKGEWSAFGGELGITSSNYSSTYGLSWYYWSSSQHSTYEAYGPDFWQDFLSYAGVSNKHYVRLCAAF